MGMVEIRLEEKWRLLVAIVVIIIAVFVAGFVTVFVLAIPRE
jgi:hypothetical protein